MTYIYITMYRKWFKLRIVIKVIRYCYLTNLLNDFEALKLFNYKKILGGSMCV